MTTIAWDGKTIAADGKATAGGNITDLDFKKIETRNGVIYGYAGAAADMIEPLVRWHAEGADPKECPAPPKDASWTLVVIDKSGLHVRTSDSPYPSPRKPPYAWGTGTDLAIGAMLAGKNATDAVRIACMVDNGSGGEITTIDIAAALAAPPLAEAAE